MKRIITLLRFVHCFVWCLWICPEAYASAEPKLPCLKPLGLETGVNSDLDISVSVNQGQPDDVLLHAPHPWRPVTSSLDNLVQIKIEGVVLLTAIQIQNSDKDNSSVTGFTLETSHDCQHYDSQFYQITDVANSVIVPLKALKFVSCVRIQPTHYHGNSPTLRLELFGCVVSEHRDAHTVAYNMTNDKGSLSLRYQDQVLVSEVRVWLDLPSPGPVDDVTLTHSRDCQRWRSVEEGEMSSVHMKMSVCPDKSTVVVTLDLDQPIRAQCLKVMTSGKSVITHVETNACNSKIAEQLHSPKCTKDGDDVSQKMHLTGNAKSSTFRILEQSVQVLKDKTESSSHKDLAKEVQPKPSLDIVSDLNDTSPEEPAILADSLANLDLNNSLVPLYESVEQNKTDDDNNGEEVKEENIQTETVSAESKPIHVFYFDEMSTEVRTADKETQTDTPRGFQCGVKPPDRRGSRRKRVVSGYQSYPGEWPWMASLHFLEDNPFSNKSGFNHVCGATLITDDWLVTAAHCFAESTFSGLSNVTSWEVYLGLHDLVMPAEDDVMVQRRRIKAVVNHPLYKYDGPRPLNFDITLIKLDAPVTYSARVAPICLDSEGLDTIEAPCVVSGWGSREPETAGSRFPFTAPKKTITAQECQDSYDKVNDTHPFKKVVHITDEVMCADVGPNREDSCSGDSGGPLMCEFKGRWIQVGIIASGYECGNKDFPSINTRISYFIDWIKGSMLKWEGDNSGV